jgi:hypothetical protein
MKKHKFKGACVTPISVVGLSWVFHFKSEGCKVKNKMLLFQNALTFQSTIALCYG